MTPPLDTPHRRTLLQLIGAAAGTGALGRTLDALQAESGRSIVLEQDDRCVDLVPLTGEEPVEDFYDYRYPTSSYDSVSGSNGYTYSSAGTTDLQRDRTSVLFLYDGPEALSLVVVHGRLDGDDDGGVVTFTLRGMPEDTDWVVRDDYYLEDGEPADSNYDRWDDEGDVHELDWAYRGGRTDGGAVGDLGDEFAITVEPAFNDAAALADDHGFGPIEAWEAVSGDREDPDRYPLRLDRPVTIRTGGCGDGAETDDRSDSGDEEVKEDAEEETPEERRQTKHEREQRKHEEKHQKRQRKHERKHRRKQRKHDRQQEKHADRDDDDEGGAGRGHERGRGRGHERGKGRGHEKHD